MHMYSIIKTCGEGDTIYATGKHISKTQSQVVVPLFSELNDPSDGPSHRLRRVCSSICAHYSITSRKVLEVSIIKR